MLGSAFIAGDATSTYKLTLSASTGVLASVGGTITDSNAAATTVELSGTIAALLDHVSAGCIQFTGTAASSLSLSLSLSAHPEHSVAGALSLVVEAASTQTASATAIYGASSTRQDSVSFTSLKTLEVIKGQSSALNLSNLLALQGIEGSDNTNPALTVVLSLSAGTISWAYQAGLTSGSSGAASGSTLTLTGTLSAINSYLATGVTVKLSASTQLAITATLGNSATASTSLGLNLAASALTVPDLRSLLGNGASREIWNITSPASVAAMTSAVLASPPATFDVLTGPSAGVFDVETPATLGFYADNYVQRLSGYITPPETGSYKFSLKADDSGELWIDTTGVDGAPLTKLIATSSYGVWTDASVTVTLEQGKFYRLEVLQAESWGTDYIDLDYSLNGGTSNSVPTSWISPSRLPDLLTATVSNVGNLVIKDSATVINRAAAAGVTQVDTVALSGSYLAGDVITITGIKTGGFSYTVAANDLSADGAGGGGVASQDQALVNIASKIKAALNTDANVTASAQGSVLNLTAKLANTVLTLSASSGSAAGGVVLLGGTDTARSFKSSLVGLNAYLQKSGNLQLALGTSSQSVSIALTGTQTYNLVTGTATTTVAATDTSAAGAVVTGAATGTRPQVETLLLTGGYNDSDRVTVKGVAAADVIYNLVADDIISRVGTLRNIAAKVSEAINAAGGSRFTARSEGPYVTLTAKALNTSWTVSAT